jgi:hypothetical protein
VLINYRPHDCRQEGCGDWVPLRGVGEAVLTGWCSAHEHLLSPFVRRNIPNVWENCVFTLGSGPRGRRFKSSRPDHQIAQIGPDFLREFGPFAFPHDPVGKLDNAVAASFFSVLEKSESRQIYKNRQWFAVLLSSGGDRPSISAVCSVAWQVGLATAWLTARSVRARAGTAEARSTAG